MIDSILIDLNYRFQNRSGRFRFNSCSIWTPSLLVELIVIVTDGLRKKAFAEHYAEELHYLDAWIYWWNSFNMQVIIIGKGDSWDLSNTYELNPSYVDSHHLFFAFCHSVLTSCSLHFCFFFLFCFVWERDAKALSSSFTSHTSFGWTGNQSKSNFSHVKGLPSSFKDGDVSSKLMSGRHLIQLRDLSQKKWCWKWCLGSLHHFPNNFPSISIAICLDTSLEKLAFATFPYCHWNRIPQD